MAAPAAAAPRVSDDGAPWDGVSLARWPELAQAAEFQLGEAEARSRAAIPALREMLTKLPEELRPRDLSDAALLRALRARKFRVDLTCVARTERNAARAIGPQARLSLRRAAPDARSRPRPQLRAAYDRPEVRAEASWCGAPRAAAAFLKGRTCGAALFVAACCFSGASTLAGWFDGIRGEEFRSLYKVRCGARLSPPARAFYQAASAPVRCRADALRLAARRSRASCACCAGGTAWAAACRCCCPPACQKALTRTRSCGAPHGVSAAQAAYRLSHARTLWRPGGTCGRWGAWAAARTFR